MSADPAWHKPLSRVERAKGLVSCQICKRPPQHTHTRTFKSDENQPPELFGKEGVCLVRTRDHKNTPHMPLMNRHTDECNQV